MKFSDATTFRVGSSTPTAIYLGPTKIWPTGAPKYNLFPNTVTYPDQAIDGSGLTLGTEFYVTSPAYVTAFRYMQPTIGTLTPRQMSLYSTTNGTASTKVSPTYVMPTPVAGQWCYLQLPSPIPLVTSTRYRIGAFHPASSGFARTTSYFQGGSGGAGAVTTTIGGYLVRPNHADSLNTAQGAYTPGAAIAFPSSVFSYPSYYSDIEITTDAPTAAYIVGTSFLNQTSASTSMTMTLPTGLVNGDRLYIVAVSTDTAVGSTITPSITGWTSVTSLADVGTTQRALYTATYSGSLVAPSWSLSASRKSAYICVAVRNATASPIVSLADGGGLTQTAPSNVSAPAGLALRLYTRKDNLSASVTTDATMTQISGALGVATGPSAHILAYITPQFTAGATGTAVTTWPVTSTNSTAWTISV